MRFPKRKFLYLHSGGVTALLNKNLCDILKKAERHDCIGLVSPLGLLGCLHHPFMELETADSGLLEHTPGSHLSSARFRPTDSQLEQILRRLLHEGIDTLFIQGGDDSQNTLHRLHLCASTLNLPIQCIGIPKTIDNDLPGTYVTPGYPSAAKYLAISFMEAAWDMMAMHPTSTKVFVLETMGRDAGWLAAASSLSARRYALPHVLCVPERVYSKDVLASHVEQQLSQQGYCMISLAEGYPFTRIETDYADDFGHREMGYQGPALSAWIGSTLGVKVRYGRPDCLQRSAGHILAQFDWTASPHIAHHAISAMLSGHSGILLAPESSDPAAITFKDLGTIRGHIRTLPACYLADEPQISDAFAAYLEPLITGEVYPQYERGLPQYILPKHTHKGHTHENYV